MWQAEADTELTLSGLPATAMGQILVTMAKFCYYTVRTVLFHFPVLGKDVGKSVACNHIRAAEYYIESISRDNISPAYPCKGEQEYESGKCFSHEQMEYIGFDWSVNNNFREHQVYQVTRKTLPYIGMQKDKLFYLTFDSKSTSVQNVLLIQNQQESK